MLDKIARSRPDETALIDGETTRTWSELADRCARVASLIEQAGVGPDGHIAVLMGNRAEYVEIILGAVLAGVWITPINRHLQPDEIAYILEDSQAKLIFVDPERATHAASSGAAVVEAGSQLESALADAGEQRLDAERLARPAGATMIYTSGTSGRPKGVQRARRATAGEALEGFVAAGRPLGMDGRGPHLVTGPMYHAAPLLFAIYDLAAGAPMVIMRRWDERRFLELVAEHDVRHTHLVPTMFVRLLRLLEQDPQLSAPLSLEMVLHGAAPVSVDVKRRMIEWWGPVLREYWGATEGGYCTLVDSAAWLDHPGTVGRAVASWEVYATGDDGARLQAGEEGLLYARNAALARPFEYHRDPDKTAAAYREDGAFTTGDVGRVEGDGYVYLTDRESNMIISGGVNIYPAEIEQVLAEHPAVADVAVFGVPDDEWGEAVKAAVEPRAGKAPVDDSAAEALAGELIEYARERLAGYKVPRSIDFEEQLPRHPTGKLYTRLLRERYWKGKTRRI